MSSAGRAYSRGTPSLMRLPSTPANPWPSSIESDKYMSFGPRLQRDLIRRHPPIQARIILRSPQTRGAQMTKALTREPPWGK
jgi:hypothetical protein